MPRVQEKGRKTTVGRKVVSAFTLMELDRGIGVLCLLDLIRTNLNMDFAFFLTWALTGSWDPKGANHY